jgi:hypothetical protein
MGITTDTGMKSGTTKIQGYACATQIAPVNVFTPRLDRSHEHSGPSDPDHRLRPVWRDCQHWPAAGHNAVWLHGKRARMQMTLLVKVRLADEEEEIVSLLGNKIEVTKVEGAGSGKLN